MRPSRIKSGCPSYVERVSRFSLVCAKACAGSGCLATLAPAFIVFLAYCDSAAALGLTAASARALGLALAAVMVVVACARYARRNVRPVDIDYAWIGLPQGVVSFIMMGFANSSLVARWPSALWAGVVMVAVLAWLEVSNLPFKHHRGVCPNFPHVRMLIAAFVLSTATACLLGSSIAWDLLAFWSTGYVLLSWLAMPPQERSLARVRVCEANARLHADEIARYQARKQAQETIADRPSTGKIS